MKYEKLARGYCEEMGLTDGMPGPATIKRFARWLDRRDITAAAELLNAAGWVVATPPPKRFTGQLPELFAEYGRAERLPHVLGKTVHRVKERDNWIVVGIERDENAPGKCRYKLQAGNITLYGLTREEWQWGAAPPLPTVPPRPRDHWAPAAVSSGKCTHHLCWCWRVGTWPSYQWPA